MDWWAGMNSCGPGSQMGDMNQIEIFDPWINCDDLDLGTILHQASNTTPSSSSNTASSLPLSSTSGQTLLAVATVATVAATATTAPNTLAGLGNCDTVEGATSTDRTVGGTNLQDGHVGFVVANGQAAGTTNSNVIGQQQHMQHQQQLAPITNTNNSNNNNNDKQNIFNVINNVTAANAISSHQISHHNQHNPQQQLNCRSGGGNHVPQTSISSSQCSSTSSTVSSLSSVESSPVNNNNNHQQHHNHLQQQQHHHHHNQYHQHQHQQHNINHEQTNGISDLYSPNSSSPILIPNAAANSPLMVKSNHNSLHIDNNSNKHQSLNQNGYSRQQDQLLQQQEQHAIYHHQILVSNGSASSGSLSSSSSNSSSSSSGQQTNNESQLCDSKRNLEQLLHLASNNNSEIINNNTFFASRLYNESIEGNVRSGDHFQMVGTQSDPSIVVHSSQGNVLPDSATLITSFSSNNINSKTAQVNQQQQSSARPNNGCSTTKNKANPGYSTSYQSTSSPTNSKANSDSNNQQQPVQKVRRCRHITDYVLADEEKRLLIKEGYIDFPMSCQSRPLSKSEEKILRKIRRKIRNKKSAQCSRQRKKEYVEDLERRHAAVIRENEELKQVLDRIQQQQQQQQSELRIC